MGGGEQEGALSVADAPLALPHIPLAHPTLWAGADNSCGLSAVGED